MRLPSALALRVFDAAARHGSFKAAAAELGVSPTAVSHQVKSLESQLSVALFVRKTRKVELTNAGSRLATATASAFQQIGDALEDLTASERTLTISTTPAFAALWLVPRLKDFEAAHPSINVHVNTSTTVVDLRRDRRIDLAIRYGPGPYEKFQSTPIAQETLSAFGSPEYVRKLKRFADAELIRTRWVSKTLPAITWQEWARETSLTLSRRGERLFNQEQEVIQAGLAGQGLILISDLLVGDMVARGWLIQFKPEISIKGLSYTAVRIHSHKDVDKVRRFLSWIRDTALAKRNR